jgi:general secretion pathway protein C
MELILQRWSWAATLAAAVLAAFLSARIVNTFATAVIAPKPALSLAGGAAVARGPALQHADLDVERFARAFDVPLPKPAPDPGAPGSPEAAAKLAQANAAGWTEVPAHSSLHGLLVGTAMAVPSKWSLCQITNTDTNETVVYAVGDRFMSARIYLVEKERVLVDNEGKNEYIDNSAAAPNLGVVPVPIAADGVKQLSENNYTISKHEIDSALTNLSDLATKARIVPSFKNGVSNGFKLFSIVPDSLYSKIGVQNGDVIRKINGYEMNSPDKALEIYQKLRDATRIEVELERRGETVRKQYSIE